MLLGALGLSACTQRPLAPEARAHAMPPEGRLITVEGRRVHVLMQGPPDAPPLILLHGASGNLRDFTFDLIPRLSPRFRVVAFDRPGLGLSDPLDPDGATPPEQAAFLSRAAADLGVGRAVLVGHSFGAAVALAWALDHPRGVGAVVCLGGAMEPWPGGLGPLYPLAATGLGGATLAPLMSTLARAGLAEPAARAIFAPQPLPEGYIAHMRLDLTLRPEVVRANLRQVHRLKPALVAMAPHYGSLRLPIELVHGTRDRVVPLEVHARPFAARVPSAHLHEIAGAGHMVHHAAPQATLRAITRAARRAGLAGA